jgi:hypothetical protein
MGSGTRVSSSALTTARDVVADASRLAAVSKRQSVELDDAIRVLRAIWNQ